MVRKAVKTILSCSLVMLLVVVVPVTSYGEYGAGTTTDLLNRMGLGYGVDYDTLKAEYTASYEKYLDIVNRTVLVESYNSLVALGQEHSDDAKKTLEFSINELYAANEAIRNKIKNQNPFNLSALISLDAQHKNNVVKINKLYNLLDSYDSLSLMEMPQGLGESAQELSEARERVDAASGTVLGEVDAIKHPLDNEMYITSHFGRRVNPITLKGEQMHNGTDFRAKTGTKVLAQFNGTVLSTGYDYSIGNYVRLSHGDGIVTIYGHLSKVLVSEGDTVTQYGVIALSGNSGANTTGPHLHLGLYINGVPYNIEGLYKGVT